MLPRMVDNLSCPNASFSFRCVFEPAFMGDILLVAQKFILYAG